jgi:hypothetical protein
MRSESEARPCTVLGRTAVPPRAVRKTLSFIPAILVAAILQLGPTQAQMMRTYASGTGNDSNPCTFTSPCRNLQAALQLTRPRGEVRSLYSADYGYVTINQAVTLLGAHGATDVLAAKVGGAALDAGANDLVTLKGLEIAGARSGADGIQFNSGTVSNSAIANNGIGVQAQGSNAVLRLAGATVTGTGSGWIATGGGQVSSASGDNSIGGNIAVNSARPTSPSFVTKNIVTDFGARCDGVADDATAFVKFNRWAKAQTLPVQLTIPSGATCVFLSSIGQWWAKDIKQLLVLGYGATITNNNSTGHFFLGGRGVFQDNAHSARLATVSAGSSSVTLLNPSQTSLFSVGRYALIAGFDLQGLWQSPYGYPPNPHFFEYVKIASVDKSTGIITFETSLGNTYKSTWPNFNSGSRFEVDAGGPATLYALDSSWDTTVEYRGLTIDQTNFQTYANGRSVTYRDVKFTGQQCGVPTQNLVWQAIDVDMSGCILEIDKINGTVRFVGGTVYEIGFQSSSTDLLSMDGTSVTHRLIGTPKKFVGNNVSIAEFDPGAYAFGRTDEVLCTYCAIATFNPKGVFTAGTVTNVGVNNYWTMNNGVITIPNAYSTGADQNQVRWAVPGTYFNCVGEAMGLVIDVTQDATNTYVITSLPGGFPPVPSASGALAIRVHPAPKFTCTGCTGNAGSMLAQWPASAPLYSYQTFKYDGTMGSTAQSPFSVWGSLSSVSFNVTNPYTGSGPLLFHLSRFDNWPVILGGYATSLYEPVVDAKVAGNRVVTTSGVTCNGVAGVCSSNDIGLTLGQPFSFAGPSSSGPVFSNDVSGICPGPACPSVEIVIQTNQGIQ